MNVNYGGSAAFLGQTEGPPRGGDEDSLLRDPDSQTQISEGGVVHMQDEKGL